jgi:hypothetical protein
MPVISPVSVTTMMLERTRSRRGKRKKSICQSSAGTPKEKGICLFFLKESDHFFGAYGRGEADSLICISVLGFVDSFLFIFLR